MSHNEGMTIPEIALFKNWTHRSLCFELAFLICVFSVAVPLLFVCSFPFSVVCGCPCVSFVLSLGALCVFRRCALRFVCYLLVVCVSLCCVVSVCPLVFSVSSVVLCVVLVRFVCVLCFVRG